MYGQKLPWELGSWWYLRKNLWPSSAASFLIMFHDLTTRASCSSVKALAHSLLLRFQPFDSHIHHATIQPSSRSRWQFVYKLEDTNHWKRQKKDYSCYLLQVYLSCCRLQTRLVNRHLDWATITPGTEQKSAGTSVLGKPGLLRHQLYCLPRENDTKINLRGGISW